MCTFYELKSLQMQATTHYFGELVPVQAGDPRGAAKLCETMMYICCGTELLQPSIVYH
jgi:hypothetical protein